MNLTLRQLRAFAAVAEQGSFTGAARVLHLTQSALSVLVRELERELGVRVFDRHTRRVELSDAGRELEPYVRRLLNELQDGIACIGSLRDHQHGSVRVAAPQMMACTLMPQLMQAFRQRHGGIEVRLTDTLPEQMIAKLEAGDVELAIGPDIPAASSPPGEVLRRPLLRDRHWLIVPAGEPLATRRRVTWRDLQSRPFIAPTRDFMQRLAGELGDAAPVPVHEVSYMTTALGMVAAGLGVTACPTYASPLVRAWGLVMRPLVAPVFEREVVIYSRAQRGLSPAAQAFADFASAFVAALPAPR